MPASRWPSAPWQICSTNGWWSVFGKRKRGKNANPGPPVHDDLVGRDFTADALNGLWLADITEHHTHKGELYICANKDVFPTRIVGYSIGLHNEVPTGDYGAGQCGGPPR